MAMLRITVAALMLSTSPALAMGPAPEGEPAVVAQRAIGSANCGLVVRAIRLGTARLPPTAETENLISYPLGLAWVLSP
jgi:hypothetical protein